jgi:tyrosyl-DNA phosphodiesterase-1
MLLVYPRGIRVVVHTANLIHVDWNYKSQGLWMQDFPWKDAKDLHKKALFENDLVDYLSALKVTGCFLCALVNHLKFLVFFCWGLQI